MKIIKDVGQENIDYYLARAMEAIQDCRSELLHTDFQYKILLAIRLLIIARALEHVQAESADRAGGKDSR